MRWLAYPLSLAALLIGSPLFAQDWAQKMFKDSFHDFGAIARDSKAEYEFSLQNIYREDVHISGVRASCGCTSVWVKDDKRTLKSWETTAIVAHINSDLFRGQKGATLTVTFDKPYYAEAQVQVRTYIRDDVVLNPGSIELGSIDQGTAAAGRVAIGASGQNWRILEARTDNPHLSAEVTEVGRQWGQVTYHLTVRLDRTAPAGYLQDHVMLVTNDPQQRQVPVPVEGRVVSAITVGPRMLSLGVVKPGQKVSKQVVVRGKTPFRITDIKSAGKGFEFPLSAEGTPKIIHIVPVTFVAGDRQGTVVQKIEVQTDLGGAVAEFTAQAIVTGPSADAPQQGTQLATGDPDAGGRLPANQPEADPKPASDPSDAAAEAVPAAPRPDVAEAPVPPRDTSPWTAPGDSGRANPRTGQRPSDSNSQRQGPLGLGLRGRILAGGRFGR